MTQLRSYISVALVIVLTLTGHSIAIARGASGGPSGFLELCTGAGPVIVSVDENGEPTGESHICPEFSLMLQNAVIGDDIVPLPIVFSSQPTCCAASTTLCSNTSLSPSARAPPGLI